MVAELSPRLTRRTAKRLQKRLLRLRRRWRDERGPAGNAFQLPQARGAVAAGGGESRAARGEFDRPEVVAVAAQDGEAFFRFVIPQTRGAVPAYGHDPRAVGSEARRKHRRGVSFQPHNPL